MNKHKKWRAMENWKYVMKSKQEKSFEKRIRRFAIHCQNRNVYLLSSTYFYQVIIMTVSLIPYWQNQCWNTFSPDIFMLKRTSEWYDTHIPKNCWYIKIATNPTGFRLKCFIPPCHLQSTSWFLCDPWLIFWSSMGIKQRKNTLECKIFDIKKILKRYKSRKFTWMGSNMI